LRSVDVEAKLKKLTATYFNSHNWSWMLNPTRPPVPRGVQRVPASCKSQLASKPEEPVREENSFASETGEPTQGVGQPAVNLEKPRVPGGMASRKKKRGLAQSAPSAARGIFLISLVFYLRN